MELTTRIDYVKATESAGDGASTLALKPMGGVNQSPKQKTPVAPQNGDIAKIKKKKVVVKHVLKTRITKERKG